MTKEDFLVFTQYIVLGCLFAVLFIPLIVGNGNSFPNMFFPFITGKNLVFRLLVDVMVLGWAILAVYEPAYRPKKSLMLIAIAVFVAVIGFADLLGENPFKSFFSNYERMEGWFTLVYLGLYTLVAGVVLRSQTWWHAFFQTSLAASGLVGILSLVQYSSTVGTTGVRLDATLGNPAYLAVYMMIHIFLVIWFLVREWSITKGEKPWLSTLLWYVPLFLIYIFTLVNTATRGPVLGLLGGLFIVGVCVAITERKNKDLRMIAAGSVILVLGSIGLFLMSRDTVFVQNNLLLKRLAEISLSDPTTLSRFTIWNMAYQGFLERPVLGWGQENFNYIFNKYYDAKLYNQEQWFDRTHNVVLDWLVAGGVLGFVSYLSLWAIALYLLWTKTSLSNREKSVFTGLFAAYFFQNLFVFDNITSYLLLFTFFAYIYTSSTEKEKVSQTEFAPQVQYAVVIITVLVTSVLCYYTILVPFAGALNLITALQIPANKPGEKLQAFQKVLNDRSVGLYEAREQLFSSVPAVVNAQAPKAETEAYVAFTLAEAQRHTQETPTDARSQFLAGGFVYSLGLFADAERYFARAHELSPQKQPITMAYALAALNNGDKEQAITLFKNAYAVNPQNEEAKRMYALGAFAAGQTEVEQELFGNEVVMDSRFLGLYRESGQYEKMIAYLENDVEQKKNSPEARTALAFGYWIAGQNAKALTLLTEVRPQLNEVGQKQVDAYIVEIKQGKKPTFNQ